METLTPVQRIAVIAIGLALTLLVAMLLVPWAWRQISEWLPVAATRIIGPAPAPLPFEPVPPAAHSSRLVRPAISLALLALSPVGS